MSDYYEILGVGKNATQDEIAKAYREKARLWHPDVNIQPEAVQKFKQISEAFEVLNNSSKRADYDLRGSNPFFGGGFPGFTSFTGGWPFNTDIFGHHGPMGRERGQDINVSLTISLEESFAGCIKNVNVKLKERCIHCEGGISSWSICSACRGTGQREINQAAFVIMMPCDVCHGRKQTPKTRCDKCAGMGFLGTKEETVKVEIPAGVENHMEIRISNKGTYGSSGRRGDLHVTINVEPHLYLSRKVLDLVCKVPVTYNQLVFGDKIKIPTLSGGTVDFVIPPGTAPSEKLKLKGLGFRNVYNNHEVGNLCVLFQLEMPPKELPLDYELTLKKLKEWEDKLVSSERKDFYEKYGINT